MNRKTLHTLSLFSLTMITVGSVDSIRNLPATAIFGSQLISFFILGALFFLIPTALVSAELASGWPKQGGVYVWVKEAFGKDMGFLAIWLQWVENVFYYPVLLMFVAGTIGYMIAPSLASNPYFLCSIIVICFWGATLLNIFGMKASSFFSSLCALCGLLLPMLLIIGCGAKWLLAGNPIEVSLDFKSILPHWHDTSIWVSLTGVMLSLCGVEIATVHANDVKDPQSTFPKALAYSAVIIIATLIFGSLAIAMVLPSKDINLVAGIMQAFTAFFAKYHALWLMPWVALMLVLGGAGTMNNWIIAPIKGLLVAVQDMHWNTPLAKTNKEGAPTLMLVIQAIIVTCLSSLLLFFPSVNGSYWFLTVLAAQLYMIMYIIMFAAVVKLRISKKDVVRPFKIPGGIWGLSFVAAMGIVGTLVTFFVGFIPPLGINVGNEVVYDCLLVLGLLTMCLPPLLVALKRNKKSSLSLIGELDAA
ncbi:MAG: transporter [Legionellales bacterium RIFCSPHIGHO2_12_FULL_37_14]|nr:MAG: transporter [Legionellales bacterium RIFCSPHIGHO2_12_FULL_37_14]